jgi:asparagine synthase (glutamine-hydrolysing)
MCGITGILSREPSEEKRSDIARMTATLRHRGPDEWGRYVSADVALGQARLSIIDLGTGKQPMRTDRSVIVFNGEIFNYIELRAELTARGRAFATTSDTEVAQQAIEEWGTDAFRRFNGQFAILYWDKSAKELLAVRDRYGKRPLFYAVSPGRVSFASELKALDVGRRSRRTWAPESLLVHGLIWNTLGDETVFDGVKSVPSGSWIKFSRGGEVLGRDYYYRLGEGLGSAVAPATFEDAKREFRERLVASVKLRLRSDVPVGCYLSGGIDSSVTSLLAREAMGDRFKTFSIRFEDPKYDEGSFQDAMVGQLGSEHHFVTISVDSVNDNFVEAMRHIERPVFRTAPLPLFLLSGRVREEGIKVVLTGEGADEILYGYDAFKEVKLLDEWKAGATEERVVSILRTLYPHLAHYQGEANTGFLRMYYEGFLEGAGGVSAGLAIRIHNNQILAKYLNRDWGLSASRESIEARLAAEVPGYVRDWPALKRNQYLEMKTLLEGYLLSSQGDRMSMSHSVEGRYPFLDHELVEWVLGLPDEWKLSGYQQKHLLRETFKDELPKCIIERPKRPYIAPDLASFIRDGEPTGMAADFLSAARLEEYGVFDPKMVERLLFKYRRRGDEGIGYRDNMLVSFILSTQVAEYWIRNPPPARDLDDERRMVDILE